MKKTALLLATLPLATSGYIQAQSQHSEVILEEITITASRRETALQDTAIAVTALSQNLIEQLNVNSPFIYETMVPSLTYQQTPNRLSIRGVGRFSNSLGVSPGVGIYNDGIFTGEATALSTQPINIERTEILRGPQGTLYGRNTTGGAVNIITRRPTAEFEGDFRVKLGDYDLRQYAGVVSGPISESLRYKLHFIDTERDGLQDNNAGPDLRTLGNTYYEAQFEWDITDKMQLWVEYGRLDSDYIAGENPSEDPYDCVNFWSGLSKSAQYLACEKGLENDSIGDPRTASRNAPGEVTLRNNNAWTARLSYDFESAQLSYLYGLVEYDYHSRTDYDETADPDPANQANLDVEQNQEQSTHELQLISDWDKNWSYIAGLYYFEDQNEQPYNINAPDNPTFSTSWDQGANFWPNPLGVIYYQLGEIDNESWAAYGEVDFPINEQWSLTLGARYSKDDYTGHESQIRYYNAFREFGGFDIPYAVDASVAPFAGDTSRYVGSIDATYEHTYTNTTGKITLSYRPQEGHLLWATASTGYKMGGTRLGAMEQFFAAAAGSSDDGQFEQEEVISWELGWKGQLMDNRLLTEVVGFYYSYDDMQQSRDYQTPAPASITLAEVVNVDTEMFGLEVSGTWLLTDNLRAMFSYSYNNTEVTSDTFFRNVTFGQRDANNEIILENFKGNQLSLTPENKAALSLHYFWPTSKGEFSLGGTGSYMDERYFDLGNHISEDSYTRLDVQAAWTSPGGRYKVLGLMTNATDEEVNNTRDCTANPLGVYGTPSFIVRCTGNPIDQRLWEVQFMVKI